MGYLFLIVFQPFGAYTYTNKYKYLLMAPYALIAFIVFSSVNLFFQGQNSNWNLFKELLKLCGILIICSILNYIYNIYFINHVDFSFVHLLYMCFYTLALVLPVSMIYMLARYLYLIRYSNSISETLSEQISSKFLTIKPDSGSNGFQLYEDDFLYAESEGNYTTIYFLKKNIPNKELVRLSLKNLEEQLECSNIVRCHRSFIVNANRVIRAKGNAQGYKLFIEGLESYIPVSRNYIPEMKNKIKVL